MYYFTALAIGAAAPSSGRSCSARRSRSWRRCSRPVTIAGEGIRELAQLVLLQNLIGAGPAIVSAALGFWAAEALTLAGAFFWWTRAADYTPTWCRVDGLQVDYAEAARAAARSSRSGARRARGARARRLRTRCERAAPRATGSAPA